MNEVNEVSCNCNNCPGMNCTCGCTQAAPESTCACCEQCNCGDNCNCTGQ